jgi:3-isopropylmalate dehydrogenase
MLYLNQYTDHPQAKGKNKPVACILSAAMLLEHFGLHEEAKNI